jgi:hypothetical protein
MPPGHLTISYAQHVVELLWQRQPHATIEVFSHVQRAISGSQAFANFAHQHRSEASAASIHVDTGAVISCQAFAPTIERRGVRYRAREVVVCDVVLRWDS